MPEVCGIVAEFNPFHNGHRELIKSARAAGAKTICCVMSGNFVQRGSAAVTEKRVRAHAALESGADLIIELPLASAVSTAQRFARGAIHLLNATGCVDMLAFGSECGYINALKTLSKAIDEPEVTAVMRTILKEGLTFAKARELAVAQVYGSELAHLLESPNNILGIEYLRQANLQGMKAGVMTIPRLGASHDDTSASTSFASAGYLRRHAKNFDVIAEYVPEKAAEIYARAMVNGLFPAEPQLLDTAILAHLRRLSPTQLKMLPDVSEGLENRMFAAIREAASLDGLEQKLKTKRYTMARIRRLVLSAFLGITAKDCDTLPPYLRVLGFNQNGRGLLTAMKKQSRLPLDTSLASLRAKGGVFERFAALEEMSTDLYSLALPTVLPCGYEYTEKGIFL